MYGITIPLLVQIDLKKKLFWLSYKTDSASSGKKVKKEINQE